jgi:hypothetical protein
MRYLSGWRTGRGAGNLCGVWGRRFCLVVALVVAGCSGGHSSGRDDPLAAVQAAADRSLTSRATFDGDMTADGQALIRLRGAVNFAQQQSVVTIADARVPASFVPFEERFVDGWSYVEISPSVQRPPTVGEDTRWIAWKGSEAKAYVPIPDRAIPPAGPINALTWLSTEPIAKARFLAPGEDGGVRVEIRFRDAVYRGPYIYTIDRDGRIGQISHIDSDDQGMTLAFEYLERGPAIVEPVDRVQRLTDGEALYLSPSTTSPPS